MLYVAPRIHRGSRLARRAILTTTLLAAAALSQQTHAAGICSDANVKAYLTEGDRSARVHKGRFYREAMKHFPVFRRAGDHYFGTDSIIDAWNARRDLKDSRWLAYMLATTYLETANRMYPVRETLAGSDATAIRLLQAAHRKGQIRARYMFPHGETGHVYFGRGYVQLTWHYNYERADKRLNITVKENSFYWHPAHALDPNHSVFILFDGMISGWFTGKCLLQYFMPNRRGDWKNARRIINGLNKAATIAGYGKKFLSAIDAAQVPWDQVPDPEEEKKMAERPAEVIVPPKKMESQEVAGDLEIAQLLEDAKKEIIRLKEEKVGLETAHALLQSKLTKIGTVNEQLNTRIAALDHERKVLNERIKEIEARGLVIDPTALNKLEQALHSQRALTEDQRQSLQSLSDDSRKILQTLDEIVTIMEEEASKSWWERAF